MSRTAAYPASGPSPLAALALSMQPGVRSSSPGASSSIPNASMRAEASSPRAIRSTRAGVRNPSAPLGSEWIGNTYLDDSGRDSPASLNSTGDM